MDWRKFKLTVLPFIIATAGEFMALFFWLKYFDQEGAVSVAVATVILWVGFLIERITVVWWSHANFGAVKLPIPSTPKWIPLLWLLAITLSEIVVWTLFVLLYDRVNPVLAVAVLFLGEQAQHSYELHAMKSQSWSSQFFKLNTAWITTLETVGGFAWLYCVRSKGEVLGMHLDATMGLVLGGAVLLLGLTLEHVVEGKSLTPASAAQKDGPAPAGNVVPA